MARGKAGPSRTPDGDAGDSMAFIAVRGVGTVRVNDRETLKVAEAYMEMLRKSVANGRAAGGGDGDGGDGSAGREE